MLNCKGKGDFLGRKIFISYKYSDSEVFCEKNNIWNECTVREYVDEIEKEVDESDHIYKAESEGEDLSYLSEETIWNKLKERIRDSSLTIVLISKNMKNKFELEINQWIPREISYSLKEVSALNSNNESVKSKTNAMLAVVIPDTNNSYDYFTYTNNCCETNCRMLLTNKLFSILQKNMFNIKDPNNYNCKNGDIIYNGNPSYISTVKWDDFINNINYHIDEAYKIQENLDDYNIYKEID
jgi:hypothetical protein